jgi:hypothetical protein
MIPKVIHFCWFGGKKKPKLVRDCISSWKKHLPDYQIIEWNEKNSDLSHPFVKEACRQKKWAFVADYIRLKKIEEFGGIYLDTDMMVLKSFDSLLTNACFFGAEDLEFINCAIIGSLPKNSFIKSCSEEYDFIEFEKVANIWEISIPRIITQKFRNLYSFRDDFNEVVLYNDVKIYPPLYFYPFPYENRKELNNYSKYIKDTSFAVHLWSSSWIQYSEFTYLRKGEYKKGFRIVLDNIFSEKKTSLKYLRKIASCIKESINYNDE